MARIARHRPAPTADTTVVSSVSGPLTAAATTVPPTKWGKVGKTNGRADWQSEAWERVRDVGELRFAIRWRQALMSRLRLVASDLDPDTGQPTGSTENRAAFDVVKRIAGGTAGQAQLMSRFAVLLTVVGEGYLAVIYRNDVEEWHVLSREEITSRGTETTVTLPDNTTHVLNEETDTLSRFWTPDPQHTWEADSDVRSALPILREIVRMGQNIEGAGKSRQAGNGILLLPEEISMPPGQAPAGAPDPDAPGLPTPPPAAQYVTSDDVRKALQNAMSTAIKDPSSAEALVPIILQTKGEWIEKVRHLRLDSEVTATSTETREKAIRRLALSLDMPAEVLLGLADLNHWSLWGVEDQALRWHTAPLMETICDGLTDHLLRPMLERVGIDPTSVVVWYDAAELESDSDRSAKAESAYDRGAVTGEAYRRELGLAETDAYDTSREGWAAWAVDRVRRDPALLPVLAPLLDVGVDLPQPAPPVEPQTELEPSGRGVPDTREALVRMGVNRALGLAGNRRRTRGNHDRLRGVPVVDTHTVLGGCDAAEAGRLIVGWDDIVDDEVCRVADVSPAWLRDRVQRVACAALQAGTPAGDLP